MTGPGKRLSWWKCWGCRDPKHGYGKGLRRVVMSEAVLSDIYHACSGHHPYQYRPYGCYCTISESLRPKLAKEIKALCAAGHVDRALESLSHSDALSTELYLFLLRASTKAKSLNLVRQIRAHLCRCNVQLRGLLAEHLIFALAKCHAFDDACQLFMSLPRRSVLSWTAMIYCWVESGRGREALKFYQYMQDECVVPNAYTFVFLLKACASISDLHATENLHDDAEKCLLVSDVFVGTTLLSAYSKCGNILKAENVFRGLSERNVVSWNAMLSAYAEQGHGEKSLQLYRQMQEEGVGSNRQTFLVIFHVCGALLEKKEAAVNEDETARQLELFDIGKAIHSDARKKGLASDEFVGNTLVSMYGKGGGLTEANNVFDKLSKHDVVSWSAMLSAHLQQGQGAKTLQLYRQMQEEGIAPDQHTFVISLQACGTLFGREDLIAEEAQETKVTVLDIGKSLHRDAWRKAYTPNIFVCNTLISMYGKCKSITEAETVFDGLSRRDIVSWNAMLSAYVELDQGEEVLKLYRQMMEEGIDGDKQTCVIVLQACSALGGREDFTSKEDQLMSLEIGRAMHADAQRKRFTLNMFVGNSLISLYGNCGDILAAETVFDTLSKPDVVSWTALLSAYAVQGQGVQALQLYKQMQMEGVSPNQQTLVILFQACGVLIEIEDATSVDGRPLKRTYIEIGNVLHADVLRKGFTSDVFVGNTLISMYGKCGNIVEAKSIFTALLRRDTVSWNAMLSAYVDQGQGKEALQLFRQMQEECGHPERQTFVIAFQACGLLSGDRESMDANGRLITMISLEIGRGLHADALKEGFSIDSCVGNTLMSMYGKCGSTEEAENVFGQLPKSDVVSWTAMISAYVEQDQGAKALQLYRQLQEEGSSYNEQTLVVALQACDALAEKDTMLVVEEESFKMVTLEIGKSLHVDGWMKGFLSDVFVANTLVSMYGKYGSIKDAEHIFEELSQRNVVSWNALLSVYVEQGQEEKTLLMYRQMLEEKVCLNELTFVISLQACGSLLGREETLGMGEQLANTMRLEIGKALHGHAWRKGFRSDMLISNTLVRIYSKWGNIAEAEKVFEESPKHSLSLWNVLLLAYIDQGQGDKVLQLYRQMLEEGLSSDQQTFTTAIQACGMLVGREKSVDEKKQAKLYYFEIGRALHTDARNKGFSSDILVANALLGLYSRFGSVEEAERVFNGLLQECNILSWNQMLSLYVEQAQEEEALQLYRQMEKSGTTMDDVTIICALQLAILIGSVEICMHAHFKAIFTGFDISAQLVNTLIRAYGSCACMLEAEAVLCGHIYADVVSYNTCVAGYAQLGNCTESLQAFEEINLRGSRPDEITFLSIFSACSYDSFIDKGVGNFESMRSVYGISPTSWHYVAMLDLLGRAGDFGRVENLLLGMAIQADIAIWLCLLGACRVHGNVDLAVQVFCDAIETKPNDASTYVLMSNIYADAGLPEHAGGVETLWQRNLQGESDLAEKFAG